nr:hypothetical protein [Morchella crassipes]
MHFPRLAMLVFLTPMPSLSLSPPHILRTPGPLERQIKLFFFYTLLPWSTHRILVGLGCKHARLSLNLEPRPAPPPSSPSGSSPPASEAPSLSAQQVSSYIYVYIYNETFFWFFYYYYSPASEGGGGRQAEPL